MEKGEDASDPNPAFSAMDFAKEKEVLEQVEAEEKDDNLEEEEEDEDGAESSLNLDPLSDFEIPSPSERFKKLPEKLKWFPHSPCWDLRSDAPSEVKPRQVSCPYSKCRCPSALAAPVLQITYSTIHNFGFSDYDPDDSSRRFTGDAYLYGFVSVRDAVDLLRNYLFRHDEEDAQKITFDKGYAVLPITFPGRTLSAHMDMAFEYDLKVITDDGPRDVVVGYELSQPWRCFGGVISEWKTGQLGRTGIRCAVMTKCVEACVSVSPLRIPPGGAHLRLAADLNFFVQEDEEEMLLHDGFINLGEDADAMTYVIGVPLDDTLLLKFKLPTGREKTIPFKAAFHGSTTQEADLDRCTIFSVTVSWSPAHVPPDRD